MSTTIGFGINAVDEGRLFENMKLLADTFGYGLLSGIESAESDVRAGLKKMKKCEGWGNVFILQSPVGTNVGIAFDIHEELVALETSGTLPKVFKFFVEAEQLFMGSCSKVGIFFAAEWYEKDNVKYSYGTMSRLIEILSMPGSWGIRYINPETGRIHDSDETPFVFDLAGLS
jgi:hypothetical protein